MAEHVDPLLFDINTKFTRVDSLKRWNFNPDVLTLAREPLGNGDVPSHEIRMSMHVHHVVEVARATAFGERPEHGLGCGSRGCRHGPI